MYDSKGTGCDPCPNFDEFGDFEPASVYQFNPVGAEEECNEEHEWEEVKDYDLLGYDIQLLGGETADDCKKLCLNTL